MKVTNATKAFGLGVGNGTVLGLLPVFGVDTNDPKVQAIIAILNVAGGVLIWLTRKNSPKWGEVPAEVSQVTQAVKEIRANEKALETVKKPAAPKKSPPKKQ